jgi:hypothetical protein
MLEQGSDGSKDDGRAVMKAEATAAEQWGWHVPHLVPGALYLEPCILCILKFPQTPLKKHGLTWKTRKTKKNFDQALQCFEMQPAS